MDEEFSEINPTPKGRNLMKKTIVALMIVIIVAYAMTPVAETPYTTGTSASGVF